MGAGSEIGQRNHYVSAQTDKGYGPIWILKPVPVQQNAGVFARFNNIAAQRYYRWDRYASQKFNFMVGLEFCLLIPGFYRGFLRNLFWLFLCLFFIPAPPF